MLNINYSLIFSGIPFNLGKFCKTNILSPNRVKREIRTRCVQSNHFLPTPKTLLDDRMPDIGQRLHAPPNLTSVKMRTYNVITFVIHVHIVL